MKNKKYFDLADILPHKAPMILINRVVEYDTLERKITAEVDISESSMFFDISIDGVSSWTGLEYMAQATGALSGIFDKEIGQNPPTFGFILGTRKYNNFIPAFKNKKTYSIYIEELFFSAELGSFNCTIKNKTGDVCAQAELNVFRPVDQDAFLKNFILKN